MTVWRLLESSDCYAVAIYNFAGGGPHQLALQVGDLLHLERECAHWYCGRKVRGDGRHCAGVFPKTYVRARDDAAVDDADIADTLRDWLRHWKTLYVSNGDQFRFMEVSMRTLLELRAAIAGGALTRGQLRRAMRTAAFTVDRGRRALGHALQVRGPDLRPVSSDSMSVSALVRLHQDTEDRLARNKETEATESSKESRKCERSLQLCVRNFVCRVSDEVELRVCVCNGTQQLTECFTLVWPPHASPDIAPAAKTVLFQDLNESDMRAERLHVVCYIVRIGAMDAPNVDAKRSSLLAGGAVVAHSGQKIRRPFAVACLDIAKILNNTSSSEEEQLFCMPLVMCDRESMESTLRRAFVNRDTRDGAALWMSAMLANNGSGARASRLSAAAAAATDRDDLYITLIGASLRAARQPPSLEVTARVLSSTGNVLPIISAGAGVPPTDSYRSVVYYRDERPRWQETFCVRAPPDILRGARLLLTLAHRSRSPNKPAAPPLAVAALTLAKEDGAAVADGEHWLRLNKVDQRRPDGLSRALAELVAEQDANDEKPHGQEGVTVATKLCSSRLTFRKEVLDVLNWSALEDLSARRRALRAFMSAPAADVLRLLRDVLDALCDLLTRADHVDAWSVPRDEDDHDCLAALALNGVVRISSLVQDHEHRDYQPALDNYIDEVFYNTIAWDRLLEAVSLAITSADESPQQQRRVLTLTKNLETVVRLAVRSRELQLSLVPMEDDAPFHRRVEGVFEALSGLMKLGAGALLAQGACLKYMSAVSGRLRGAWEGEGVAKAVGGVLKSLCGKRLPTQRAACLLELARGPLMAADSKLRPHLLPVLVEQLAHMIQDHTELELCLGAVAELVSVRDGQLPQEECNVIAAGLLAPLLGAAETCATAAWGTGVAGEPRRQRLVAALLDALRLADDEHWSTQSMAARGVQALVGLCEMRTLPRTWVVARGGAAEVMLRTLRQLAVRLEGALVAKWLRAVSTLARAWPTLAHKLAQLLRDTWHSLDDVTKECNTKEAISSTLDVSLVEDVDVRDIALPLLSDVIGVGGARGEDALVDELDVQLGERGRGDEQWEQCAAMHLPVAARPLVGALLLLARAPAALRPLAALQALATVRTRPAVYVRHAHRLARALLHANRPSAAARALGLHSALLPPPTECLPPELRAPTGAPPELRAARTTNRLRTALALESAALLLRAGEPAAAARTVRKLQAMSNDDDPAAAASLHLLLHKLYCAAAEAPNVSRALYRVRHLGALAPTPLCASLGRVVMGAKCELLGDFCARVLSEWPSAKLLHSLDEPTDELLSCDAHYIQINAVECEPDSDGQVHAVWYSRPVMRPDPHETGDQFANMWIERTHLLLEECLPGVIEDVPVRSMTRTMLSPLQVALATMRKTNAELRQLLRTCGPQQQLEPLTRKLLGVADAPVQGGVSHYDRFLKAEYVELHPEDRQYVLELRRLLSVQAMLVHRGVDAHDRLVPPELRQLHEHIAHCADNMQRYRDSTLHVDDMDEDEMDALDVQAAVSDSAMCRQMEAHKDAEDAAHDVSADVENANSRLSDVPNGTPTKRTLLTSLNQFTRYTMPSSGGAVVNTIYNTKKRDKQRARRSDVPTTPNSSSQWYTSNPTSALSTTSVNSTSDADAQPLRELWQDLAPSRPPRPLSQRLSTQTSGPPSNRNSTGTTSEEELPPPPAPPPPLPHKSTPPQRTNTPQPHTHTTTTETTPRYNYDTVLSPRGSFLYTSLQKQKQREH